MSSDYRDYHSPEKVNARRRTIYIREHAHLALRPAMELIGGLSEALIAQRAVALTAALYDALPPDPDQEQGSGAPATRGSAAAGAAAGAFFALATSCWASCAAGWSWSCWRRRSR